jgi:DNA-binding NarL/FixJ family response regulator
MSHTLELLAEMQHGTVAGYRAGCHGSQNSCGAAASCATVYTRYQGDWGFRKRVDAGEDPVDIFAAELAEAEAVRVRDKAANRKHAKAEVEKQTRRAVAQIIRQDVERLAQSGLTSKQIAAELGVSPTTVARARHALGVSIRVSQRHVDLDAVARLHGEGMLDKDIAEKLDASRDSVSRARKKLGLPRLRHTKVSREDVSRLHAEGLMDVEIAARLGIDPSTVAKVRKQLGVSKNARTIVDTSSGERVARNDRLADMVRDGLTDAEIAEQLAMTVGAVSQVRRSLGLTSNRPVKTRSPRPAGEPRALAGHGTNAAYARGCRCDDCKTANREYMREYRASRKRNGAGEHHGTAYGYQLGCRGPGCPSRPSCTHMMLEQDPARRRAAGIPSKELIDAYPARAHIGDLHAAGMSYQRIAEAAGVPWSAVKSVMFSRGADRPPVEQLLAERAAAILSVPIPEVTR